MVDILMATYNGEKYIARQLDSILSQSYEDIRLHISDDFSTDSTWEILEEYQKTYPKKLFLYRNTSGKKGAKWNFLHLIDVIKKADANYVMFADQDDIWYPNKVEKTLYTMQVLEQRHRNLPLLVYSNLALIDEEDELIVEDMAQFLGLQMQKNLNTLLVENCVTGNTMMINRALIQIYKRPEHLFMHDHYLALLASIFGRLYYMDGIYTSYRQHSRNLLGAKKTGIVKRIFDSDKKREVARNYQSLFATAYEILRLYQDAFLYWKYHEKEEILKAFASLEHKNRIQKIQTILKYRFLKSKPIMSLGMMLNI